MTKNEKLLAVAFLALLVFPLLYLFRAIDDNSLTSWQWVFETGGMLRVFGLTACGTAAALLLSRTEAADRRPGLFLFLLSFAAVVPLWSEPEVILDASRYFLQAKHLELYGPASFLREWGAGISAWTDLPLVPLLYGLVFRFAGEARIFIQILTTLLFSGAVLLTYHTGRRIWNTETGFLAGLLLLGSPFVLTQVPLMLVDVPMMFFLILALAAFLDARERGGTVRIVLAALSVVLFLCSKYSAPLMLPVLFVAALVVPAEDGKRAARRSFAVAGVAALLAAAAAWAGAGVIRQQLGLLRSYQLSGLSRWSESRASTYLFQIHPFIAVLALLAIIVAVRNRDPRFLIPACLAPLGLLVERIRYLLPLFPLLCLAAAFGLGAFREKQVRRFAAFSVIAASLVLALAAYLPFLERTTLANLERAGSRLDALPGERVVVRVLPQRESSGNTEMAVPLLDLYTKKRIFYRPGPLPFDEEEIRRSSLRFTWECPLPPYYYSEGAGGRNDPVAVITDDPASPVLHSAPGNKGPAAFLRQFASDTGTFLYRTVVTLYAGGNPPASRLSSSREPAGDRTMRHPAAVRTRSGPRGRNLAERAQGSAGAGLFGTARRAPREKAAAFSRSSAL